MALSNRDRVARVMVHSWPRLQELANELRQNQPPEQLGLF
jgi:hypothetical protein